MSKPFQVRGLHVDPSEPERNSLEPTTSLVQISSSDYDHLAANHPRARLSYNDDDGDHITVGSSLELTQRLDEIAEVPHTTMHIFDIRRSNSVTELWKRFKYDSPDESNVAQSSWNVTREENSRPLLAAFEAELAQVIQSTDEPPERVPQPRPSSTNEFVPNPNFQDLFGVAEALATNILNQLMNGANLAHSELRTRLPELRRQVRNAQRHAPGNIGARLQNILSSIEAQLMLTLNNLPDNRSQWLNSGQQLVHEAIIQIGRPLAENATRVLSSELNQVRRTLFSAFENEVGRFVPQGANMAPSGYTTFPTVTPYVTNNTSTAQWRDMDLIGYSGLHMAAPRHGVPSSSTTTPSHPRTFGPPESGGGWCNAQGGH